MEGTRKERAYDFYTKKHHDVSIETLEFGDYIFADKVCFEYKNIDDFMHSISNKSVFEEVANQTMNYDYSYLIIVGSLSKYTNATYYAYKKYNSKKNWSIKQKQIYDGAIRRLRTYCNVITVNNEEKAFLEMLLQSQKCITPKKYAGTKRRINSIDPVTYLLGGCGGISDKKAEKIKKELKLETWSDLDNLTIDELIQIDGIGEKTVEKIMKWLKCSNVN